jgi:hypothetical protein
MTQLVSLVPTVLTGIVLLFTPQLGVPQDVGGCLGCHRYPGLVAIRGS